jgi:hypothetical protein
MNEHLLFPAEAVDAYWAEQHAELDAAEEFLAELEDQHGSECSLAGDSWPGAQIEIDKAFAFVVKLRKEMGLPHKRGYRRSPCGMYVSKVWVDENGEVPPAPETEDLPF